jgi:phage terminase large subunit-like protein
MRVERIAESTDYWNAHQTQVEMEEAGLPVKNVVQGYVSLNHATKEILRMALSKLLKHDDNPVMNWCVGNTIVDEDSAGNWRPNKKKSRGKIDGVAALANAVFCGIAANFGQADSPQFMWLSLGTGTPVTRSIRWVQRPCKNTF